MTDFKYIVSLTSHKTRVPYVLTALGDILNDPRFKVVLTLFEGDLQYMDPELSAVIDEGKIELITTDVDYGSHKKYLFTFERFKDKPIITIDDDWYYTVETLNDLINTYVSHKDCVCARTIQRLRFKEFQEVASLKTWRLMEGVYAPPSELNMAIGYGGVLYPPGILSISPEEALTCISDDILLKAKEIQRSIKVCGVPSKRLVDINVDEVKSLAKYTKVNYQEAVDQFQDLFQSVIYKV